MTSNGGRATAEYLAKCALASGDYIDKQDNNGVWYRYQGRLGIGTGWKSGACDKACQEKISACMLAHMNSTGNHVPIFINGDPDKMPSVGISMAYQSGSDAAIQEGVFMGNMLAKNPPDAYYAKGNGFKASIAGRLGANSGNPYKAWTGYRPDTSAFYTGVGDALCMQRIMPDNEHWEFVDCGKSDSAYGQFNTHWSNVLVTYVNRNYNSSVNQDFVERTLNFEGDSTGNKTNSKADIWTTANNFEFQDTVNPYSTGIVSVQSNNGSKRVCINNVGHLVMTKNTGEPFSLKSLKLNEQYGNLVSNREVKITGYVRGTSTRKTHSVWLNNISSATLNWDNLIKVEIKANGGNTCVDDVVVKT
jgi:hypothetical protein